MKYRITEEHDYGSRVVKMYRTEMPSFEAELAFILLEKWGPVCAMPDGEDSAGRAKVRGMTPAETVQHAFDIASEAMRTAHARGLMVAIPDLNEINAEVDAKREAKREKAEV